MMGAMSQDLHLHSPSPPNSQEVHFREIADNYVRSRREYPATRAYHQYWDRRLHDLIHPRFGRDARYLDPMCGAGLFLETPISRFDDVLACDLSDEMLDYVLPEVRARLAFCDKADVRALPFEDNAVDIILIRGGLHHVANHLQPVVAELFRVLKPGGQFIFSEPVNTSPPVTLVRHLMYTKTRIFDADEERGLTVPELRGLMTRTGFENFYYEPFTHLAYCIIGNTDFLPVFSGIRHPALIQAMIGFDEVSRKIPLWNQLCWIGNFSCFKPM